MAYKIKILFFSIISSIMIASDCMDIDACNYNPDAIVDDGSCYYPIECPDNSAECNINDCNPPDGFEWNQSNKLFFIFIDYAYKFNSEYPLNQNEDWIAGFKSFDETQNGICDTISDMIYDMIYDMTCDMICDLIYDMI